MDKNLRANILKGSAATSIGTITGMVFQFLTVMVMTRYVSKDDLGIYVLVIVIVNMFNLLGGFGVELTMVKFIASKKKEESHDVLFPVLVVRTLGSFIFSIVFILTGRYIMHLFDDRIYNYIWYILAIFILANYRDLFYNLMQGLNQFKQYSIVNVTSSAFRIFVMVIFLLFGKLNIKILLIIEILSTGQPLIHQLFVIPFKKYLSIRPTWEAYKRVINFSIPLYLNNLVVFINGQMNIFIIGAYLNPASVANYDVASKVPVALRKIFSSFIIVYFPNLATLFSDGEKKTAVNLIERSIGIFSISIALLFVFSFLFRTELTLLLFSSRYVEVSVAFALLILNFFIRGLGDLMGYPFVPAGYPSIPARVNALASVISIGLSFMFVPIFGYMGVVYALLIMNIFSTILFYIYLVKYKISPKVRSFLKPMIIFLIVPISLLFGGQFLVLIKCLLLLVAFILGWIISEDLRSAARLFFSYVQKYIHHRHSWN
jgi:O-antigen/teichoic acid export membrane protein